MEGESTEGELPEAEDSEKSSFVRWQQITLTQLGYAVNVILAFATASLGFSLSLIRDKDFSPGCWGKAFMMLGLCLLVLSVALGIWCAVNRLASFRHTRNAARIRQKRDEVMEREREREATTRLLEIRLGVERARYRTLDKRTWLLFWFQIATFTSGILSVVASFVAVYRGKLF